MRSDTNSRDDPRATWRWLKIISRTTPRWLGHLVSGIAFRIILWWYRASFDRKSPEYRQFHLWIHGTNAELYRDHVKAALDVLALHAPTHIRWLRSNIDALVVDQLFMIVRSIGVTEDRHRLLVLHPYTVWKVSAEQLALYLIAEATSLRLGRGFSRTRAGEIRAVRRQYEEMVACARAFPHSDELVAHWEKRLAAFDAQFPKAAA
jgi:hypothetical protein